MEILIIIGIIILLILADIFWGFYRGNIETVDVDGNFNCKDGCGCCCKFSNNPNRYQFGIFTFGIVRKLLKKSPIWILPTPVLTIGKERVEIKREEIGFITRANQICIEIKNVLKSSPDPATKKDDILKQTCEIPFNIQNVIWKLYRIRRIRALIEDKTHNVTDEAYELEKKSLLALRKSLQRVATVPLRLMKVELEDRGAAINKILSELEKVNEELRNLASSRSHGVN